MKYVLLILIVLISFNSYSYNKETLEAIDRTNLFFEELQERNYPVLWSYLTKTSRSKIISDIISYAKPEDNLTKEKVAADFETCSETCKNYWLGFLSFFDPAVILDESEWNISEESSSYVEVKLINSENNAQSFLKIYKENNSWQFGLTESFWLRKFFN